MKFCKDCKFYINQYNSSYLAQCSHQQICKINPVDGQIILAYCNIARDYSTICGIEARLFEHKNST